jgi:hypothetical protein
VIDALAIRVRNARTVVVRATLAPLLVRVAVFACLAAAVAAAFPADVLLTRFGAPLLLVALVPAVAPRGAWPTVAIAAVVIGWVVVTSESGERIALWRLVALAGLLYLTHSLSALAAVLPSDAIVAPEVLARWVSRAAAVVLAGAVLGVLLVSVAGIGGGDTMLAAAVAGLAVAVAAAALLGWLVRRRA